MAPDLRGYGDSDKPEKLEEYHISKLRDDVRDLVKGKFFLKLIFKVEFSHICQIYWKWYLGTDALII